MTWRSRKRLALLVDREVLHREERRLDPATERLCLACACRLPIRRHRLSPTREGWNVPVWQALASCDWIGRIAESCITGPSRLWQDMAGLAAWATRPAAKGYPSRIACGCHGCFEQVAGSPNGDGQLARLMTQLLKNRIC